MDVEGGFPPTFCLIFKGKKKSENEELRSLHFVLSASPILALFYFYHNFFNNPLHRDSQFYLYILKRNVFGLFDPDMFSSEILCDIYR